MHNPVDGEAPIDKHAAVSAVLFAVIQGVYFMRFFAHGTFCSAREYTDKG
jgi:hypothetical protein